MEGLESRESGGSGDGQEVSRVREAKNPVCRNLMLGELGGDGGTETGAGGDDFYPLEKLRQDTAELSFPPPRLLPTNSRSLPPSHACSPIKLIAPARPRPPLAGSRLPSWTPDKRLGAPNNNHPHAQATPSPHLHTNLLSPSPFRAELVRNLEELNTPQSPHTPPRSATRPPPINCATMTGNSLTGPDDEDQVRAEAMVKSVMERINQLEKQAEDNQTEANRLRSLVAAAGSRPRPSSAVFSPSVYAPIPAWPSGPFTVPPPPSFAEPSEREQEHFLLPSPHDQSHFLSRQPSSVYVPPRRRPASFIGYTSYQVGVGYGGYDRRGNMGSVGWRGSGRGGRSEGVRAGPWPSGGGRMGASPGEREAVLARLSLGGSERDGVSVGELLRVLEAGESDVSVEELSRSQLVGLAQEREGSRWLQSRLEQLGGAGLSGLCEALVPEFKQLVNHRYANYVLQKLIEALGSGTESGDEEMGRVTAEVVKLLPGVAEEMHGCRVLQSALAAPNTIAQLLAGMRGHLCTMIKSQYGNHVVQKLIDICVAEERKPEKDRAAGAGVEFVIAEVCSGGESGLLELSHHVYGCRVLQKLLEEGAPAGVEVVGPLLALLRNHVMTLATHEYGNYVAQHLIKAAKPAQVKAMVAELRGSVVHLAQHEHASHVVEAAVQASAPDAQRYLIQELLDEPQMLRQCIMDQYANYVVQVMVRCAHGEQRRRILREIRSLKPHLLRYTYGQQILAKLDRELAHLDLPPTRRHSTYH